MCKVAFVSILFFCSTALAGMGPIPGEERFAGLTEEGQNSGGAALMFGGIGEDFFLQIQPRLDFNFGKIGLGVQVPLNLRIIDNKPKNKDDFGGIIREEDWDEFSDFLKVVRYVRYGHKHSDDLLYLRVGEIAADLGHGTIMARYMNNVDVNTFRLGSQVDVYTNYGGVETVVSDYGSFVEGPESRLFAFRGYFKPYALIDPESFLNMFAVGFSVATDLNAPRAVARIRNADGDLVNDLDPDGNFKIDKDSAQTVYGFDLEAQVINTDMLKITPYTDLNFIGNAGWGWHLGSLFTFSFPIGFDLVIPARLEYRRFRTDYIPSYFSTFYEIERYAFGSGAPKAKFVGDLPDDKGINGFYGDLAFSFAGLVQIGAVYEDYDNSPGPTFAAFMSVPALEVIQFKAYYTRAGIQDFGDVFVLDERSLLVAEARYELVMYVYLVGRFTRRWVPANDGQGFDAKDDWNAGIELSFSF